MRAGKPVGQSVVIHTLAELVDRCRHPFRRRRRGPGRARYPAGSETSRPGRAPTRRALPEFHARPGCRRPAGGRAGVRAGPPPLASRPSGSTVSEKLPCERTASGRWFKAFLAVSMASASAGRLLLCASSMLSKASAPPSGTSPRVRFYKKSKLNPCSPAPTHTLCPSAG